MKPSLFVAEENNLNPKIHIHYHKAPVYKKVFARLFDLLLALAIGISLFLGVRALVLKLPSYQKASDEIHQVMTACGIYEEDREAELSLISKKHHADGTMSPKEKTTFYQDHIDVFLRFIKDEAGEKAYQMVSQDYDAYRLEKKHLGTAYFVSDEAGIVTMNPDFSFEDPYTLYNQNVYEPFINERLTGHLNATLPSYVDNQKKLSQAVYFIEVPLAAVCAVFLVMALPGIFFRRGRETLGMRIYHISLADSDLLSVRTGKYIGYSFIRIFFIYLLSFYTLGVPLIIDVSLMAFSRQKQDFGEYMLGLYELDTSSEKVYLSKAEIALEQAHNAEIFEKFKAFDKE